MKASGYFLWDHRMSAQTNVPRMARLFELDDSALAQLVAEKLEALERASMALWRASDTPATRAAALVDIDLLHATKVPGLAHDAEARVARGEHVAPGRLAARVVRLRAEIIVAQGELNRRAAAARG